MFQPQPMLLRLCSLALFRSLLGKPPLTELRRFCSASSLEEKVEAYASFAAAVYTAGGNLTSALRTAILEEENVYMLTRAQKKPVPESWNRALAAELAILEEVSQLTPEQLQSGIDYSGYLPEWETEPAALAPLYEERMTEIPRYGYGVYARHHAFLLKEGTLEPVLHPDEIRLDALSGYERERAQVIRNTAALLQAKPAANILLYGDAGTGKSATVKAVANAFHSEGLRLIELKKNQLHHIPTLMDSLSRNPLKFILFIDDLSFSRDDDNFSALKAVLEGSVSAKTRNLAIYATSNRRHLVKECFSDRQGDEIHAGDTLQELVSLSDRFGLTVTFTRPAKQEYLRIAAALALQQGLKLPAAELSARADQFALHRGGYSPRTAKQFVESLLSQS